MTLRWECLEAGCGAVVTAGDEDDLIEKVNAHVARRTRSYELEDVILANAEEIDDGRDCTKTEPADVVRRLVEQTVFTPVREGSAVAETVERLGRAIEMGLLRPGDRLPPEGRLSADLGISPVTLRSAIAILRGAGLVETQRGRGGGTTVSASPRRLPRAAPSRPRPSCEISSTSASSWRAARRRSPPSGRRRSSSSTSARSSTRWSRSRSSTAGASATTSSTSSSPTRPALSGSSPRWRRSARRVPDREAGHGASVDPRARGR